MRVLVIDDSSPVRARLTALLGEGGSVERIDEASDGAHGIALARAQLPDVIVLDLQLSGGSGLDVLRDLKNSAGRPTVIVLTNHATEPHRRECLARGADYFFDKSLEFERAALVIQTIAGSRSL